MTRCSTIDVDPDTLAFRDGYTLHAGFKVESWRKFQEAGGYERLREKHHPITNTLLWVDDKPCALTLAIFVEENQWEEFKESQLFRDIAEYSESKELVLIGE